MKKWLILIILLMLCSSSYANFDTPFIDFGTNRAGHIFTDTTNFDGTLDASDTTVQSALETLDDLIMSTIPCAITDDWCFIFANSQLVLYVNGTAQAKWPQVATQPADGLLLESGDFVLLENGDKLLIE